MAVAGRPAGSLPLSLAAAAAAAAALLLMVLTIDPLPLPAAPLPLMLLVGIEGWGEGGALRLRVSGSSIDCRCCQKKHCKFRCPVCMLFFPSGEGWQKAALICMCMFKKTPLCFVK